MQEKDGGVLGLLGDVLASFLFLGDLILTTEDGMNMHLVDLRFLGLKPESQKKPQVLYRLQTQWSVQHP